MERLLSQPLKRRVFGASATAANGEGETDSIYKTKKHPTMGTSAAATRTCVIHWDIENLQIPTGCSAASVANRIRDSVRLRYPVLLDSFVYCDVSKTSAQVRSQLSMLGFDVVDCSSLAGKSGQVDLRIIARALKPSTASEDRPAVVICSGDSDYAYAVSSLRNACVPTMVLYDSDRPSIVHTLLLEAADDAVGVSFSGRQAELDPTPSTLEQPVAGPRDAANIVDTVDRSQLTAEGRAFVEAIERSMETDDGGWRLMSAVGDMFRKLCPDSKSKTSKIFKFLLKIKTKVI